MRIIKYIFSGMIIFVLCIIGFIMGSQWLLDKYGDAGMSIIFWLFILFVGGVFGLGAYFTKENQ